MNKLEMIRGTINFMVGLGVGSVVNDALKKVQPAQAKGAIGKLVTKIGGFAIGLYVTDKIGEHVDGKWIELTKGKEDSKDETKIIEEIIEDEA